MKKTRLISGNPDDFNKAIESYEKEGYQAVRWQSFEPERFQKDSKPYFIVTFEEVPKAT